MDVIFLAYANSREHPLQQLEEESLAVYETLIDNDAQDNYLIHNDPFSTVQTINNFLGRFTGDIALFNYSGHAGGEKLLLGDRLAHAGGIITQLADSVDRGSLKLVMLNGCSTDGQVRRLLEAKVPAIVATSAAIDDYSAREFAKRFYRELLENEVSIREAYGHALAAAQLGAGRDLAVFRRSEEDLEEDGQGPVWGLFGDPDVLDSNPFVYQVEEEEQFEPNTRLFEHLFEVFHQAGNPEVVNLAEKMTTEIVEAYKKRDAILYSIPFPIAANLSNLVNLQASRKEADRNRENDRRRTSDSSEHYRTYLMQVGQLYHTSSEFMGFVMIAQLWEIKLKFPGLDIPQPLRELLNEYFYLPASSRKVYDYMPLISGIRSFIQGVQHPEIGLFIDEQVILKDLMLTGESFASACVWLLQLHREAQTRKNWKNVLRKSIVAEEKLCDFFSKLGFLYKYHLTSITQIDILKYRHEDKQSARFKHRIIKLMRPMSSKAENTFFQYFMPTFLDNWGVVLVKSKSKETVRDPLAMEIDLDKMDFLNLSPFIIDRIVYEENADISTLMFFHEYFQEKDIYAFNDASCLYKTNNIFRVNRTAPAAKKRYELESIRLQFKAFRKEVLGEP